MAFSDARIFQCLDAFVDELTGKTLPSEIRMDGKMVDESAPAVVTAQYSTDHVGVFCRNKAHPRISLEIGPDAFPGVSTAQANPLALFPQSEDAVILIDRKP